MIRAALIDASLHGTEYSQKITAGNILGNNFFPRIIHSINRFSLDTNGQKGPDSEQT